MLRPFKVQCDVWVLSVQAEWIDGIILMPYFGSFGSEEAAWKKVKDLARVPYPVFVQVTINKIAMN